MEKHGLTDDSQLPEYFVTAQAIPFEERIDMQAAWQNCIDASISSTINLPNSATVEDVEALYMLAWAKRLKGVTIFREGCRRTGILTTGDSTPKTKVKTGESSVIPYGTIISPSDELVGKKRKLQTGCGTLHVIAFFNPATGDLQEIYFAKGSTGGCHNFMGGLSRIISLACRAGAGIETVVDQLRSTGVCPSYATRAAVKRDAEP